MAVTSVSSKEALVSVATQLSSDLTKLDGINKDLDSVVSSVSDYDGIPLGSAGAKIRNNSNSMETDFKNTFDNIASYAKLLVDFDVNDYESIVDSSGTSSKSTGTTITLPAGLGSIHTYMGWQCITAPSSKQYKLRQDAGMKFDAEGFGKIGDRYVVATTTTFGNVGDYIDVKQADGSVLKCIIGDIKSQNDAGCNQWGHNNGQCVVEFVVDKDSWYGKKENPGTAGNHPEWNQNIVSITNVGNYWGTTSHINETPSGVSNSSTTSTTSTTTTRTYSSGPSSSSSSSTDRTYGPSGETTGYAPVHATKVTIKSGDPNIDVSKYHNCIENGFEVTVGNKAYELGEKDIDLLMAIVSAESDKSYDDALAVITTILNRCESPRWIASHGTDPVAQATAPNQFVVYQHGSYLAYTNGKAPDTVKQAVMDALKGVRNHKYLSFRSNGSVSYSNNMISPTGNRYL